MILWKKAVVCLAFLVVLSSSVFAVEYSTEYPSYVPISGGAYIEVQSTLGRGSLVFPNQYQNNTFGFSGSGLNLCNITHSLTSSAADWIAVASLVPRLMITASGCHALKS